ncbi:MAG: hypothetical protein LBK76_00880, partial [Verrucomicrobiales bacterium]|nr:hypothetical protein [Verrucomicrobiales bacterium]
MKTSIINKISKLTLTLLCALSVSALNVFAQQSLYVNGTAYVEPGAATYSATSTARAALEVLGTSAAGVHGSYTGTGITISSTFGTGNGRYGIYVYRSGTLTLTDGSISTDGSNGGSYAYGIYVTGTSVADLQEVNVTTKGLRGHALQAEFSSTLSLVGGMLYASGSNAWGISAATFATVSATNVMIHTDGVRYGYAVQAAGDAEVLLTDVTISTSGDEGIGLRSVGTIRMTGGSIQTSGSQGQGMQSLEGGLVEVTNVTVKTSGQDAYGGYLNSSTDLGGAMYLNNVTIETTGMGANGVNVLYTGTTDATTTLVVNGGSINAQQAIGIAINAPSVATTRSVDYLKLVQGDYDITIGGGASVTGETAALALSSIRTGTDAAGNLVEVDTATMIDFQITENSTIAGDVTVAGSATAAINFDDSTLTGDIITIDKTVLTVTASNGAILTGDVISSATSTIGLTLSGSDTTLTGTLTGNNNSTLEVTVSDHSTITGDLIGTGSSTLAITVNDNGTLAGDLTTSDNNTTTVTISDSGIINGDLTSTGNSTLGVTVSDNGTLTGNLTASDNSSLTLGISEDSTVIGNITGSGSSTLDITISDNSTLAGNLTTSDDTITTVTISDGGTITGDFTASGNSDLTLDLSENGTVSGNITGTGSSTLDITVSDSGTLAGNITTSEDNNTTVNVSAGGAIIGDLTGSDNSTLAVTVDDGGTLTGALNGEQVTVTVNTGGNVTINQDSDFNALANSGNVTVDTG